MFEGLFKLIFPARNTARLDPCFGDPAAQRLRDYLAKADFEQAEAILDSASDAEQLDLLLGAATEWPGRPSWIEQWPGLQPNSPWARLVRGIHSTRWAWEVRTAVCAVHVKEEAWRIFFERLSMARDDLNSVDRSRLRQSVAQARMIRVQIGQQMPKDIIRQSFDAATHYAPNLRSAHFGFFTAICAKWGGSDAQMFAFARESAARFHGLASLIAAAHIEAYIALEDASARRAYFDQAVVVRELVSAFEKFKAFERQPAKIIGANFFAMALVFGKQLPLAREAFALTEGFVAEIPWCYWGDAEHEFAKFKGIAHR